MQPTKHERDLREDIRQYMLMGVEELSPASAKWLSKSDGFKKLLHFLAKETPATVRKLYDEVYKEAMREFNAIPQKTTQKRSAAEFGDPDCSKKARMDGVQQLGKILSENPERQADENDAKSKLRKALEEDGIVLSSAQEPSNVQVLEISAEEEAQQNERPKVPHAHDSLFIPEEKASEATAEKEAHYELGLTRGVKPVLVQVWEECCKLLPAEHRDRLQYQIKDVFNTCAKLSFLKVQHQLVSFLENRSKAPHPKAQAVPNTWETNDPHLIFNTLQTLEMHSLEVNIHRVYGQIRFFTVVNETATGRQRSKPAKLIRDLLLQRTENQVSQGDLDKKVSVYKKEYDGGRRWLEVSYWFGGMGVILVFMVAGISIYRISTEWTEVQRRCLEYSARYLGSIKRLVECLGPSALKDFCEHGFLSQELMAEVKKVEGPVRIEECNDEEKSDSESEAESDCDEKSDDEDEECDDEKSDSESDCASSEDEDED